LAEDPDRRPGTVRPTGFGLLALLVVIGGVLGWAAVPISERLMTVAPTVEWTSVVALFAIAAVLLVLARSTYRTVQRDRRHIDPQRAVSFLLLAKASAIAGAVIAGGYLGFGLQFVDQMEAALPLQRVVRSLAAALGAFLIVGAALLLEHACRVPDDDEK
jgi:lysylphosphatidylglycerol synthetase-like protein (DUF2156 family)